MDAARRLEGRAPAERGRGATLDSQAAAGHLPLGSRELAYLMVGAEFDHADVPYAERVIARARRAGLIPWTAITDGRTDSVRPWVPADADDLAEAMLRRLTGAMLDRQAGQPCRIEIWAEAQGWLPRLRRIALARGVPVFSGSGSVPVSAVRAAALRAVHARIDGQPTAILQIGDFDLNGLRNIARPFTEDLEAFVRDAEPYDEQGRRVGVDDVLVVRRLLLTADQVADLPARKRSAPSARERSEGWPWPWTAQAEAMLPADRDRLVAETLDDLHDVALREEVIAREPDLHEAAGRALVERLNGSGS